MSRARPLAALLAVLACAAALSQPPRAPGNAGETTTDTEMAIGRIREALEARDFVGAEVVAREALKKDPASSDLHLWLGRVYGHRAMVAPVLKRLGLAGKCRGEFEKAVALDRNNVRARWDLLLYHLQAPGIAGGNKATAREQATAILALEPVRGHLALGMVAEKRNELAAAEAEFRRAIDEPASPNDDATVRADAHWRLGLLYERLGKRGAARDELKEALRLEPSHPQAQKDLERLGG